MTVSYLDYQLVDGYIHNWLVAGPQVVLIQNLESFNAEEEESTLQGIYKELPEHYHGREIDFNVAPADLVEFEVDSTKLTWHYYRCLDDHFVDLSASYPLWSYLRAWAYTQIKSPEAQQATLVLTTSGPADVWLNGTHIHRQEHFHPHEPQSVRIPVQLGKGDNQVLVRLERVAVRECPNVLALQVADLPEEAEKEIEILVPSQALYPRRHKTLEEAFEKAYLEEVVNHRGAHFNLRWADDLDVRVRYAYQVQDKDGLVYVEGNWETDRPGPVDIGHTFRLFERPFYVVLKAPLLEYVEHGLRYQRRMPLYVIDNAYASTPYKTFTERNREALEDATKHSTNLYGEIAKLGLGHWADFKPDLVMEHIERVNRREDGSDVHLVGLLGMMYRYMNAPDFPGKLKKPLEACVLNFKYWQDEGPAASLGSDAMAFNTESHSILFHTCEVLAGQLYPGRTFANAGKIGKWHRKKGARLALEWLRRRGTLGFQDWDSNFTFERDLLALSHLTSLAKDVAVQELAAVLMDKLFFTMAVNSFKGSFGSTHGRTCASMLKSAQLEATSGITRMMWGTGALNPHILGTVSLACSRYEFPLLIGDIANDTSGEVWSRERHMVDPEQSTAGGLAGEVNKVTYKTPDYMLCSAQDYRPGESGADEHIWQATLGPDALVFVNHPACMSEAEAHHPGFWLGNRSLPRLAQWKEVLVAVYRLPEDDWMGFTHAYFPIYMFSEHEIKADKPDGRAWAFARKENGYLALTASQGFELVKRGPDGYRELRSYGQNNVWLCQMGRSETDGSFEEFKKEVLAMDLEWQELAVRCKTLRGEHLSFGWEGPLLVNGKEQSLHGFKHYDSPYAVADLPASQMDISLKDTVMRLNFA
jgi:hypothetical protein